MTTAVDTSKYRYIPGESVVIDDLDLDALHLHDINGNPITEESLERDADEAERIYHSGLIPGGKSLSGGSTHSPRFQVILGEATAERARQAAADEGMSMSRWLRRVVEEKLAA